jgi:hypothetical protein
MQRTAILQRQPERAMHGEGKQRGDRDQHGVPIEDAGLGAGPEIGPQRQEEIAGAVEGDAAHYISQRCTEEDREQGAGTGEY